MQLFFEEATSGIRETLFLRKEDMKWYKKDISWLCQGKVMKKSQ